VGQPDRVDPRALPDQAEPSDPPLPTVPAPSEDPPLPTVPTVPPPSEDPPPHRWGIWAYVLVEVLFLAVSFLIGFLVGGPQGPTALGVILGLSVPTLLAAGVALLVTRLRGNGPALDLGLRWTARDVGIGLLFGFGGLILSIPASLVFVAVVGEQNATTAVGDAFAGIHVGWPVALLVFLLVAFVAPVCEEIVYRGLLWGAVTKHRANRWVAFAVTTVLFAVAHLELTRTPLLLVVALPIGLARVVTGRLPASIVAHQVNNLVPALGLALALTGAVPALS
jgi:membrane protease YdiL (CAAX protease family)